MAIKNMLQKAGAYAGNAIAKAAVLSPDQLAKVESDKELYYSQKPDPSDPQAIELTRRLLASAGTEIYSAYLPELSRLYLPVDRKAEYPDPFRQDYNIRWFRLTRWVSEKEENPLEKLVNVYESLASENCNIALVFHRTMRKTEVYLGIINLDNSPSNAASNQLINRLQGSLKGNFPGSVWEKEIKNGPLPFLDQDDLSVAAISNLPGEKSEKFQAQTIEKLLDGIVPQNRQQDYTLILLATPVLDLEERKVKVGELYTALQPYSQWQTNYTYNESSSTGSSATASVNIGVSAGVQTSVSETRSTSEGTSRSETESRGTSESISTSESEQSSSSKSTGTSQNVSYSTGTSEGTYQGEGENISGGLNVSIGIKKMVEGGFNIGGGKNWNRGTNSGTSTNHSTSTGTSSSVSQTIGNAISRGNSTASNVSRALGRVLSTTVGTAVATTKGAFRNSSFGAGFSRSSNVTATIGKNEGIVQTFTNYTIKHALDHLEAQMKRLDQASALGMWDFSAYVVGEDLSVVSNAAHTYLALTQGETSFLSTGAVNVWRGDLGSQSQPAKEIVSYLRELRHPVFGLNPDVVENDPDVNTYPTLVTGTTALTGKELAWSLNFPKHSVSGFPVSECTAFGRNIVWQQDQPNELRSVDLGKIWHLNQIEPEPVFLPLESLTSHTFIAGSTGSGKSNTINQILNELIDYKIPFLVIEPAKGEYKDVFGSRKDTSVYGTNPKKGPLLKINPFSFPDDIHVLEHIDRLVEIFNVCWPMYAAMPAVLKDAVIQSYEQAGWDMITSENKYDNSIYPAFKDVAENVRTIINSSEYDAENKGAYKGALLTRLNSLTNGIYGMIFTSDELSNQELFEQNVIADLSRIGSQETKSLLMGLLFLKLQEHRMAEKHGMNEKLRHVTVLEEAHHLLKHTESSGSSESGNLQGKSVEMLSNAIAEMRTCGEGFIIADQAPGLLDRSAIRNTNTKILMKMPDLEDRQLSGKSAALSDNQIDELGRIPTGVAAVYQNGWIEPVLCKVHYAEPYGRPYKGEPALRNSDPEEIINKISIADLLLFGDQYDSKTLKEEHGDLLEKLSLSGKAKAEFYHAMAKPQSDRVLKDTSDVMKELFEDVYQEIQMQQKDHFSAAECCNAGYEKLHTLIPDLDLEIEQGILICLIQQLFTETNNIELYEQYRKEIELHKQLELEKERKGIN